MPLNNKGGQAVTVSLLIAMLMSPLNCPLLIRLSAVFAVLILSTGCPQTDDEQPEDGPVSEQPVEQPADPSGPDAGEPQPIADGPELPVVEPAVLPESTEARPLAVGQQTSGDLTVEPAAEPAVPTVDPAEPEVEPVEPHKGLADDSPRFGNPLRDVHQAPPPDRLPLEPVDIRPPAQSAPAQPAPTQPRIGKRHEAKPFDPIEVNGPVFVGWPKPKLALIITGRQRGYIEPCGCAGLDRMKGGMTRRHTFFKELRQKSWPVVGIDVGGIARGYGRQAAMKFHTMVDGMRAMNYDAITLGKTDLLLETGELLADAASMEGQKSPFLSANVALFGFDAKLTADSHVVQRGGMRLGITGVLGPGFQKEINNREIEMRDPQTALRPIVDKLKTKADFLILLAHASMDETLELAKAFPEFQLVVTAAGAAEPPKEYKTLNDGKTILIEVGEKGMDAVVLGIFDDEKQPFRYQRVPLDSRFAASLDMQRLMEAYQDQLKAAGFSGLGIRPVVPHPGKETGGRFVGTKECKTCHEESYRVWKKSKHAKAFKTLVELKPPRQFDPECVSCHVTGWHPTKYFPYQGGYASFEKTPQLIDVGCETCHGPGGAHVKAEQGSDEALQVKLQKALVITKEEAADAISAKQNCFTCHDGDNSPDFDFKTYWPDVEHYEDEE